MGWWADAKAKCAAVYSAVKTVAKKAVKVTKDVTKKVCKGLASGLKSFTGQKVFDEAKRLLEDLRERARALQTEFDSFAEETHDQICGHLNRINGFRKQLEDECFERFMRLTAAFSEWEVHDVSFDEIAQKSAFKVGDVRSQAELFTIDFDSNPVKENLKAFLTLGFLTRKQAHDSLEKVKLEEKRFIEESERVTAEKKRLQGVCASLEQIVTYFESFHGFYEKLLDELEYAVCFLRSASMLHGSSFVGTRFDVYYLPKRHLLCLMASEKMTRIMYDMGKRQYLDSSLKLYTNDVKEAEIAESSFQQLKSALVA
ncbi:MAG: hypothetical protein HN742_26825 [Lentisphaerae bacterium]|jgi:hypothetical protein|nr:hypothetical protein [Lentisphaerota bacterium]MBT7914824.1 hypothetical protein [Candidatus Bathyarchaeota archaeon]MBT4823023.1 hypothetical protein [Lentisphaerota bacterium]MBT5611389.1 hypothetical protein [Lentisphaerota bacterium]MBT7057044.1 hypothetical protein [Lentisphaerota bacterium]